MNTRIKDNFSTLFPGKELSLRQLPTQLNIYMYYRFCLPRINRKNSKIVIQTKKDVVLRIIDIWDKSSIPHLNNNSVYKKVTRLIENIEKLKKRQHQGTFKTVIDKLKSKLDSLFDICTCTCVHICICIGYDRIPPSEKEFLKDQRTCRKMYVRTSSTTATTIQSRSSSFLRLFFNLYFKFITK